MSSDKIVKALLRNKRISVMVFLPILFLGIVLSSTPIISVANVGVIVNFLFQRAYPMDAYALLNLSFEPNTLFSYKYTISTKGAKTSVEISGIRFLGNISKVENKIWKQGRSKIYRFGDLDLGGIGILSLKRGNWTAPFIIFFLGPRSGQIIFGKKLSSPQIIVPQIYSGSSLVASFFRFNSSQKEVESTTFKVNYFYKSLIGSTWNVSGTSFRVSQVYYPGSGKYAKISYDEIEYLAEMFLLSHEVELKLISPNGTVFNLGSQGISSSNCFFVVLPSDVFSKISSLGSKMNPIEVTISGGRIRGGMFVSHLAIFTLGINPRDFINRLYDKKTFEKKLLEEINQTEKTFLTIVSGVPIISWGNFTFPSNITSYLGEPVLIHYAGLKSNVVSYLTDQYVSEVLMGRYTLVVIFIFTFPLLLLVALVILTTVLENSLERSRHWIRTMLRRGIPSRVVGRSLMKYSIILGVLGAASGIAFSGIVLPRIIRVMLSVPLTTSPSYYFGNYFLYLFSLPSTVLVSIFSVRKLAKGVKKIPLVGVLPEIIKSKLGISKATLVMSLMALYGVIIWYFRISPAEVLKHISSPMVSALFIILLIVTMPFLMISPLLIPRFFSLLSFIPLERVKNALGRISKALFGDLGELGFNSSRATVSRIKIMGYSLTLALSTTFGMILVKGALPKLIGEISVNYSGMLGIFFYILKAVEMFLAMISIFSFAIGIVGTYGCILEMIDEVRPQLIVARARGACFKDIMRISYGALFPYLLYSCLVSVGVGFSLFVSVDALLGLFGGGVITVPHLIPAFDPFFGMYFAYLALILVAPYIVTRVLVGHKIGEELRRVWS